MKPPDQQAPVLLVSLQVDLETIGLKSLHYILRARSLHSILLYLPGFDAPQDPLFSPLEAFIRSCQPCLVGLSLMSHEYSGAVCLTRFLKDRFPDLPVIWGGIHPTLRPEMCLEHADYVCVGEGETAFPAFVRTILDGRSPEGLENILTKRGRQPAEPPLAPLVADLDSLPYLAHLPRPAFIAHKGQIRPLTRALFKRYSRWQGSVYSFMASRGCPYACAYCCNNYLARLYQTRRIRRRSVDSLIGELRQTLRDNPEVSCINFQDDCFLACSDTYLAEFCRAYKKQVNLPFVVRLIPAFVSKERLAWLSEAGLAWVSMGLQSGSDRVLTRIYGRPSRCRDFLRAAAVVNGFPVGAYYDVIFDNPLESDRDRLETLQAVAATPRPFYLQIFSLVAYPRTALYEAIVAARPELAEQYLSADYHDYGPTNLNRLTRLSAYLPPRMLRRLLQQYGRKDQQWRFRATLWVGTGLSALVLEPRQALQVLYRSQRRDLMKTFVALPRFYAIGMSRYLKQYTGPGSSLARRLLRAHGERRA